MAIMRIEVAEEIIGRRWQYWTDQEILEFVQAMEPSDLVYPRYIWTGPSSTTVSCRGKPETTWPGLVVWNHEDKIDD